MSKYRVVKNFDGEYGIQKETILGWRSCYENLSSISTVNYFLVSLKREEDMPVVLHEGSITELLALYPSEDRP